MIKRYGKLGIAHTQAASYTFEIKSVTRDDVSNYSPLFYSDNWEENYFAFGRWKIMPYGANNNLPLDFRDIMDNNGLAAGLTSGKTDLQIGDGPYLYKEEIQDGVIARVPVLDNSKITRWLKSFDWENYLIDQLTNYNTGEIVFYKYFLNRGNRLGRGKKIAAIKTISPAEARFEFPADRKNIKNLIVGNWNTPYYSQFASYPVFDHRFPFKHKVSVGWSNRRSFGRMFYNLPSWFAARKAIKLVTSSPELLQAYLDNSISPKFHVVIPQSYVDNEEEYLRNLCKEKGEEYKEDMLDELIDAKIQNLINVLGGIANVGKMFVTRKIMDERGNEHTWEILPIEQNMLDSVKAYLEIYKTYQFAETNAFAVPTALSNISTDGNLSSGSEILYSLKLYLATHIYIPEHLVCEAINRALEINFNTNLKVGFYHQVVKREEDTTPKDRIANKV